MAFKLIHRLHDAIDLRWGEQPLFRYVYEPRMAAQESPKPYFHPLHTLAGNEVTGYRPHDHVWHKGLSMTSAQLSGQNFWGGPTYVRDRGYIQLDNNGRMEHRAWSDIRCADDAVALAEQLAWVTAGGELWLAEDRQIGVTECATAEGYWSLDFLFRLRNSSGLPLTFGSPTTEGRPLAGYGGLFWRGPRSFLGGTILAGGGGDDLEGPAIMGQAAPWLAFSGRHDGNSAQSTLLFLDHPENPRFPTRWFVRNDPFACVSCAFMFDQEYRLAPEAALTLRYRVVVADGAWSRERIAAYAGRYLDEGAR